MIKINFKFGIVLIILIIITFLEGGYLNLGFLYLMISMMIYSLFKAIYSYKNIIVSKAILNDEYEVRECAEFKIFIKNNGKFRIPLVKPLFDFNFVHCYDADNLNYSTLEKNEEINFIYKIRFGVRGVYEINNIDILIKDIFNILEIKKTINIEKKVVVYPKFINIKGYKDLIIDEGEILNNRVNNIEKDEYEIKNVRKYVTGDNIKHINWKLSAKYNDLYVRENESVFANDILVLVDMKKNILNDEESEIYIEEEIIDFSICIINYLMRKKIGSTVYINNKKKEVFKVKTEENFGDLIKYFILNKSEADRDICEFIKVNLRAVRENLKIIIFLYIVTQELIEYLIEVMWNKKIIVFYKEIDEYTKENYKNKREEINIELVFMKDCIDV